MGNADKSLLLPEEKKKPNLIFFDLCSGISLLQNHSMKSFDYWICSGLLFLFFLWRNSHIITVYNSKTNKLTKHCTSCYVLTQATSFACDTLCYNHTYKFSTLLQDCWNVEVNARSQTSTKPLERYGPWDRRRPLHLVWEEAIWSLWGNACWLRRYLRCLFSISATYHPSAHPYSSLLNCRPQSWSAAPLHWPAERLFFNPWNFSL